MGHAMGKFVFILLFSGLISSCSTFSSINRSVGLKDDNFIEEMIEDAIEDRTGIDVDLTPNQV